MTQITSKAFMKKFGSKSPKSKSCCLETLKTAFASALKPLRPLGSQLGSHFEKFDLENLEVFHAVFIALLVLSQAHQL